MRRSRFTEKQIFWALREHEAGVKTPAQRHRPLQLGMPGLHHRYLAVRSTGRS